MAVDLVAQLVEHNTFNVGALGSSPSGITATAEALAKAVRLKKLNRSKALQILDLRGFLFFEHCQKMPKNSLFRFVIRAAKQSRKKSRSNFSKTLAWQEVQNLNTPFQRGY